MTDPLDALLSHPAIWRASRFMKARQCQQQARISTPTGFPRLDQELPDGGWPLGGVLELLTPRAGRSEMSLMMPALTQLSQQRLIAWIKPPWIPYVPALIRQGLNTRQLLWVDTDHVRDSLWALEQCLHSGACAAALCWPESLQNPQIKRLHLAAQRGQCLAVLLRPVQQAQNASAAPLRIELGAQTLHANGQLQCDARVLKRRGGWPSDWFPLRWISPLPAGWPAFSPIDTHRFPGLHHPDDVPLASTAPSGGPRQSSEAVSLQTVVSHPETPSLDRPPLAPDNLTGTFRGKRLQNRQATINR